MYLLRDEQKQSFVFPSSFNTPVKSILTTCMIFMCIYNYSVLLKIFEKPYYCLIVLCIAREISGSSLCILFAKTVRILTVIPLKEILEF